MEENLPSPNLAHSREPLHWTAPSLGQDKVNFDCAISKQGQLYGVGGVIYDFMGDFLVGLIVNKGIFQKILSYIEKPKRHLVILLYLVSY